MDDRLGLARGNAHPAPMKPEPSHERRATRARALLAVVPRLLAGFLVTLPIPGCTASTPPPPYPVGAGVLVTIDVDAQDPSGEAVQLTPDVRVVTPNGNERHLTQSEFLTDLGAGTHQVVAHDVWVNGVRYMASPPSVTFEVSAGAEITIAVAYAEPLESGVYFRTPPVELLAGAATYHIDCANGDDDAAGTSAGAPWRTLGPLSGVSLHPGDRLLLRRGCTWEGPLHVPWSGNDTWPVTVGAYGEGPRPEIRDSGANHVDISGSYVVVDSLRAFTTPGTLPVDASCEDQPVAWRTGFTIQGGAHHVTVQNARADGNTAGVHINRGSSQNRVLHNELHDNIVMSTNTNDGGSDDSGAWGIVVNGSDNEIAYNGFRGNNAWCSYDFGQEGASIEIYEGERNFVHNNVSVNDTTFSELGGSDTRKASGNVYAYNRYTSDRRRSQFLIVTGANSRFGPTSHTHAYNNTVYLTNPDGTEGVVCHAGCGPELLTLKNNLIWVEGKVLYTDAAFDESHNLYWRSDGKPVLQFFGTAMHPTSMVADPRFVDAASDDFRLAPGSPAIDAGTNVALGIDVDVTGVPIPQNGVTDIGAHEYQTTD